MAQPVGTAVILKKYFDMDINQAKEEIMKGGLSKDEKTELADLAAAEMGYTKRDDGKYNPPS